MYRLEFLRMGTQRKSLRGWLQKVGRKIVHHRLVHRIVPNWSLQEAQDTWDRNWANPGFAAAWVLTAPPEEVVAAIQNQWFPPGAKVLDIGCGSGELSAWLAPQGFDVTGIDFAHHAIQKAREKHQHAAGNIAWQVVDICREFPEGGPFDVLIDRGCLHGIPPEHIPLYRKNLLACSAPGTRFLLFHKIAAESSEQSEIAAKTRSITDLIQAHFESAFEIVQIAPTTLLRASGNNPKEPMASLAFWMVKKEGDG